MPDAAEVLASLGGIAPASALTAAGIPHHRIESSARRGLISRVRRGWYATPDADTAVIRAIRVGGSASCVSACATHGLWILPDGRLHVGLRRNASSLKHPVTGLPLAPHTSDGVVLHWRASAPQPGGVAPLIECLATAAACQPEHYAFAMVESALRGRLVTTATLADLGGRISRLVALARNDADSGTESVFRYRMWRLGVLMRSQVEIPGVGRVDFLIGDRLVVEIDSAQHHGGESGRRRDLNRDAILAGLGAITLRFDYHQILEEWKTVEEAVLATIARGDHLDRRRS